MSYTKLFIPIYKCKQSHNLPPITQPETTTAWKHNFSQKIFLYLFPEIFPFKGWKWNDAENFFPLYLQLYIT
jgi:hypothetical protein